MKLKTLAAQQILIFLTFSVNGGVIIKNEVITEVNISPEINSQSISSLHSLTKTIYKSHIPLSWRHLCITTNVSENQLNVTMRKISCTVHVNDTLDFATFRRFTSEIKTPVLYSLSINCKGGMISMPKYARAKWLHSISVDGCMIKNYNAEATNNSIDNIPDNMSYYAMKNSILYLTNSGFFDFMQSKSFSKTFQCGPTNAEMIIERNLSTKFIEEDPISFSENVIGNIVNNFYRQHRKVSTKCHYKNLLYFEKSYTRQMSRLSLKDLLKDESYPNIEVFNLSSVGLVDIPSDFKEWRLSFRNLNYVDLTRNKITEIGDIRNHATKTENSKIGILDLRYNNISVISIRHLAPLMSEDLLKVDIKNNPFSCICEMKDFIQFIKMNFTELPRRYKYLSELQCYTPFHLRGRTISHLTLQQIGCEIIQTSVLKAPVIVLCSLLILLSISTILMIRYRKEIIILTYTRLNIVLPCQQRDSDENKEYDAFVAYSEADTYWVVRTLLKRLENPENPQVFRLCLHHRDFIVGAAISDNIINSVENSRHTVIVVSKKFVKSEWCRLEFRTALHQSLLEKKRHLIIVLLEDIPSSEFEPELKRCIQTLTYVKVDDRWFWDKLIYALSDGSKKPRRKRSTDNVHKIPKTGNNGKAKTQNSTGQITLKNKCFEKS